MTRKPLPLTLLLALVALGALGLAACGGSDGDDAAAGGEAPAASEAWARTSAMSQDVGAMYMMIAGAAEADALTGVEVPSEVAAFTELHETVPVEGEATTDDMGSMDEGAMDEGSMEGMGAMKMQQVQEIPIPADGTVALEPGGYHVMLMELAAPLEAGSTFTAMLTYASGATEEIEVEVRDE
jgi:copper(I)-binding protein